VNDLALQMNLPLIIVSRIQVGILNHTLLTINAARQHGLKVAGVILNPVHEGTLDTLQEEQGFLIEKLSDIPILGTCPYIHDVSSDRVIQNLALLQKQFHQI
jgi:dethiobiotin synthetase